jgi:hypothetical protein
MTESDQSFSYNAEDLNGIAINGSVRLNPVHSAVVHLLARGGQPLLSLELENQGGARRRLRVSVRVDGYSDESVDTLAVAPGARMTKELFPVFLPERIATLNTLTPATIRVHIDDLAARETLVDKTLALDLLAINSAPLSAKDPVTGDTLDQTRYFGAFVTPDDPAMEALIGEANRFLPAGASFSGYLKGGVRAQVQALYDALATRNTRYVDSTLDFNPAAQVQASQRVRLPRQSLAARQANCIDGTLLLASLLEHIGIEPAIVIIPGHAFLAWAPERGSDTWRYLETTVIGVNPFDKAVEIGTKRATAYEKRKDETGDARFFRRWPLRDLRARQIFPLPVTGDDSLRRIAQALELMSAAPAEESDAAKPPETGPAHPEAIPTIVPSAPAETGSRAMAAPSDLHNISGPDLGRLQDAMLDQFSEDELRQLVRTGLDKNYEAVAGGPNYAARVFDLLDWARRRGLLGKLVVAAAQARPGGAVLAEFAGTGIPSGDNAGHPAGTERPLTAVQRAKRDALQRRLALLLQQHEAASNQLNTTLDAANRVILQGQIDALFAEMEQVEAELNDLLRQR